MFKEEVKGLHGPSGQRQIDDVIDFVRPRESAREVLTLKLFPLLCLLSGLPDCGVRFSTDVNQERGHVF